jgi:hypothetical protein
VARVPKRAKLLEEKAGPKEKISRAPALAERAKAKGDRPSATLQHVLIGLLQRDNECMSINWRIERGPDEGRQWTYFLNRENLRISGNAVRNALQKFADDNTPDIDKQRDRLREVAKEGATLYEVVMTCALDTPDALDFREWFDANLSDAKPGTWAVELHVTDAERPLIPWGLVFIDRNRRDFDDLGPYFHDYQDFWCHRFNTACYNPLHHTRNLDEYSCTDGSNFQFTILSEDMNGRLSKETRQIVGEEVDSHSERTFKERLHAHENWHHIVYFDLSEKDGLLVFEPEKGKKLLLSAGEFTDWLESFRGEMTGLAFLGRAPLVRSEARNAWIDAFLNSNWNGFIAIEVETERHSVLRYFGIKMLAAIVSEESRWSDLIPDIRRRFWPWSLTYGIYCNPRAFYIKPKASFSERLRDLADAFYNQAWKT